MFYGSLDLTELNKIHTINELVCAKYGLISLPLFDVSQVDLMLESLRTRELFYLLFYLYFLYNFIINIYRIQFSKTVKPESRLFKHKLRK